MTSYPINEQVTTLKVNSEQDLFEISPSLAPDPQDEISRQLCEQNCLPALSLLPPCARILAAFKVNGSGVFCKAINIGCTDVEIEGTIRFKNGRFQGFNRDGWVFLDCCDEPIDDHLDVGVILALCDGEDHVFIRPDDDLSPNASISIGPKGTGFICAQTPTPGSPVGGNCRGMNAVDWQQVRSAADQVAGALRSVITGGSNNRIGTTSSTSVISGGNSNNIENSPLSIIGAGDDNIINDSNRSGILTGIINRINNSLNSSITSGRNNIISLGDSASGNQLFIGSGQNNFINSADDCVSNHTSIVGGLNNIIGNRPNSTTNFCFIGGGESNVIVDGASNQTATHNSVVGGSNNTIGFNINSNTTFCVICGGINNLIDNSASSSIVSGNANEIDNSANSGINSGDRCRIVDSTGTFIGAGLRNVADDSNRSSISSGIDNSITTSNLAFIGSGNNNSITNSNFGSIGSGNENSITNSSLSNISNGNQCRIISCTGAFIGSGFDNFVNNSSDDSSIVGGFQNTIGNAMNKNTNYSFIGGGRSNNIGSGMGNQSAELNSIVGGLTNRIGLTTTETTMFNIIGGGEGNTIDNTDRSGVVTGIMNGIATSESSNISGGAFNSLISCTGACICGGDQNSCGTVMNPVDFSNISGGQLNTITSSYAVISGGESNTINPDANHSFIGGGNNNIIMPSAVVGSGRLNVIGGGRNNLIEAPAGENAFLSVICGGQGNGIRSDFCALVGGTGNNINNFTSFGFIGGGENNFIGNTTNQTVNCSWSSIVGGEGNRYIAVEDSDLRWSVISGGSDNIIGDSILSNVIVTNSVIAGGGENIIVADSAIYSVISGGRENIIGGNPGIDVPYSVIAGGQDNLISPLTTNSHCTISGGFTNIISKTSVGHTIVGGRNLTISSTNTHTGPVTVCGQFNREIATALAGGMGAIITAGSVPTDRVFVVASGTALTPFNLFSVTDESGVGFANVHRAYRAGGADYAEYFESNLDEKIPPGISVVFDSNGKIRPAHQGEIPFGVISETCNMVGNNYDEWHGKYERNEFGAYIYEEEETEEPVYEFIEEEIDVKKIVKKDGRYYEVNEKKIEEKKVPVYEKVTIYDENDQPIREETVQKTIIKKNKRLKISKDFDPNRKYIPRKDRPEWNVVGLLGQVFIRKGQPIAPNWIKIKDVNKNIELWLIR